MNWFLTYARTQWERTAAFAALVIGIVALILGWIGTSRTGLVSEQLPYLVSGGLAGVFALGIAGVLWISADLRDEWIKLEEVENVLHRLEDRLPLGLDLDHGQAVPTPKPAPNQIQPARASL